MTGERRSLQRISRDLAAKGYVNERGRPFNPKKCARGIYYHL